MKWITEAKSCWVLLHISSFPGYTGKFSRPWENLPRRGTWPLPLSGVTYYCSDEDQPLWLSLVSLVLRAQNLQTVWLPVTITLTTDIVFFGGGDLNAIQGREVGGGVGAPRVEDFLLHSSMRRYTRHLSVLKSSPTIQIEDPAYGDVQGCIERVRNTFFIKMCMCNT